MNIFKPNGVREIDFDLQKSAIVKLKQQWKAYAKTIEPYPGHFEGRGLVMVAGGIKYFTCAYIAVKILRKKGCKLPVEIWHQPNELSAACIEELKKYNVQCRCFTDCANSFGLYGWMLKPFAILNSRFREVLFIDADNICMHNPEVLLEVPEYKATGALFWSDYWKTAADNPIWKILGLPFMVADEQESGQMVINKEKCWAPLNLCMFFNRSSNVYYRLLLGDKDTFRFAWMALKYDFYMVPIPPDSCGYIDDNNDFMGMTMVQHHTNGTPFFLHRNLIKWDISKTSDLLWQYIKRFADTAANKGYTCEYSVKNSHYYVDFSGDCKYIDFRARYGNIEDCCLDYLDGVRKKKFYHDLLLTTYLHAKRIH